MSLFFGGGHNMKILQPCSKQEVGINIKYINCFDHDQPVREEDSSAEEAVRCLLCDSAYSVDQLLINLTAPEPHCEHKTPHLKFS